MAEPGSNPEYFTPQSEFIATRVKPRVSILDIAKRLEPEFLQLFLEDPDGWIEELSNLYSIVTGHTVGRVIGQSPNPDDPALHMLSDRLAITTDSNYFMQNGIWLQKDEEWINYAIPERATVFKKRDFSTVNSDQLQPDYFEKYGKVLKEGKRLIVEFPIDTPDGQLIAIAKQAQRTEELYCPDYIPAGRKTNLSQVHINESCQEAEGLKKLHELGIPVPQVIGYYESIGEQWIIETKVIGAQIDEWLGDEIALEKIIQQDATMLAKLCRLGIRKQGFCDFDDKLFDGETLYLIDADEAQDLYLMMGIDFQEILNDPTDTSKLSEFRDLQKATFLQELKDALYVYQGSLLTDESRRCQYIQQFISELGWELSEKELTSLLDFGDDNSRHMTRDMFNSLMLDCD